MVRSPRASAIGSNIAVNAEAARCPTHEAWPPLSSATRLAGRAVSTDGVVVGRGVEASALVGRPSASFPPSSPPAEHAPRTATLTAAASRRTVRVRVGVIEKSPFVARARAGDGILGDPRAPRRLSIRKVRADPANGSIQASWSGDRDARDVLRCARQGECASTATAPRCGRRPGARGTTRPSRTSTPLRASASSGRYRLRWIPDTNTPICRDARGPARSAPVRNATVFIRIAGGPRRSRMPGNDAPRRCG